MPILAFQGGNSHHFCNGDVQGQLVIALVAGCVEAQQTLVAIYLSIRMNSICHVMGCETASTAPTSP